MKNDKKFTEYLTAEQLANLLGYTVGTIYNWINTGRAPENLPRITRLSNRSRLLFAKQDVKEFLIMKRSKIELDIE